jgi:hypothetical protein
MGGGSPWLDMVDGEETVFFYWDRVPYLTTVVTSLAIVFLKTYLLTTH